MSHDLLSLDEAQHLRFLLFIKVFEFPRVPAQIPLQALNQLGDQLPRLQQLLSDLLQFLYDLLWLDDHRR